MSEAEPREHPPSFEAALSRLEALIAALEGGAVPLAELLERYEEGSTLLRHCEGQLQEAELKLETLQSPSADKPVPASTAEAAAADAATPANA